MHTKSTRRRNHAPRHRPGERDPVQCASIWKIAIKSGLGRPDFTIRPKTITRTSLATGFTDLPVRAETAGARAMTEPVMLFTADAALERYSELVRRVGFRTACYAR